MKVIMDIERRDDAFVCCRCGRRFPLVGDGELVNASHICEPRHLCPVCGHRLERKEGRLVCPCTFYVKDAPADEVEATLKELRGLRR